MANTVKMKRSAVAGKVPTTSDLQLGELAVNTYDGKLYLKKDNGTPSVVEIGAGTGSGDVVGPSSATDNALARFDGTTGKLIQNGTVTQDDNGNLAGVNGLSFNTSPTSAPTATGSMFWDSGDGTPAVILDADVSLQLGQENVVKVYNGTGSTIANGSVVAVSGAQGQRPSVVLADADSEALSAPTLGIATESIANGAEGFVTTFGVVRGLDTSAFTAGAPIYLSSTAGQFTSTKPVAPQHLVALGWVVKVNASSGEVFVNINNGWELDELHNVLISSAASGNTLIYDASAGVWKNANLTAGTAISVTGGAGSITIANTGVTSAVAGTGISVSGATGAVTISNTGVTSVSGTSPVVSSGGATPAISLASGYGDTQNPYASKTANYFLAAPNGSAGVPTFRAIATADVPTLNQNTTGSAASLSVSGQTGLLTFTGITSTNRAKTVRDAADTILELGGSYTPTGTWNWTSATATWPTFNQNTTGTATYATNIAGGAANRIPYNTGSGATSFITAPTTASTYLQWNGTAFTWASAGGGSSVSIGLSPPSTPSAGDLWWSSDEGKLKIYYTDATPTSQWVDAATGTVGAAGTNGTNGADGAAATIAVGTTTTGSPGSSASVTNSGTSSAAVFNFTIPQGATGSTGPTGPTGPMGPKAVSLQVPTNGDKVTMFYTTSALTLSKITSVLVGGTSVAFVVYSGTSRATASATNASITANSTTTGTVTTSFTTSSIAATSFVWVEVGTVTGAVSELSITLEFA